MKRSRLVNALSLTTIQPCRILCFIYDITGGNYVSYIQAQQEHGVSPTSTEAGSVDKIRLQRVVDVMQRFLGFGKFDIGSMLMGSSSSTGG